jgi:hypothetical protein
MEDRRRSLAVGACGEHSKRLKAVTTIANHSSVRVNFVN